MHAILTADMVLYCVRSTDRGYAGPRRCSTDGGYAGTRRSICMVVVYYAAALSTVYAVLTGGTLVPGGYILYYGCSTDVVFTDTRRSICFGSTTSRATPSTTTGLAPSRYPLFPTVLCFCYEMPGTWYPTDLSFCYAMADTEKVYCAIGCLVL